MTAAQVFTLAGNLALLAWLLLLVLPRRAWVPRLTGVVVPLALAALYTGLIAARIAHSQGGFDSLAHVRLLFADDWLLLAGWVHYLAFDLFVGSWEARDAARRGLSPWLLRPCLVLTFLFGPAGLLAYTVVRRLTPEPAAQAVSR